MQRWTPRVTDLAGGLQVRRALPVAARRSVGPFVFFDHFGPVSLPAEADTDVGPHPHIGLATVTYLFEGGFLHRDSLGTVQEITPGAVNWMTAGRGIVHSERTPEAQRGRPRRLHGLQLWVALPPDAEQGEPAFQHVPAEAIPQLDIDGATVRLLLGEGFGLASPVRAASPMLYLDIALPAGVPWTLPRLADEMAIYSPEECIELKGEVLPAGEMAVVLGPDGAVLRSALPTRVVVIGGAPLDPPRVMWWNFVASDRALIERAAERWAAGGFEAIPGETGGLLMPPRPLHPGV
ncbi:pirin family protein [Ideonella sp.]|uniref:pirin family protein n=1 Tax=Ideonella sp. TaxID=1929293 RepID=UPI002B45DE65|nr:pirin family protein [Ideonella sp.]HJV68983.1 pirin family protein [Ideonella sp.]